MLKRKPHHKGFKRRKLNDTSDRRFGLKRGKRLGPRVPSRSKTEAGDSARTIKDECDQLVREIIRLRDCSCVTCNLRDGLHVGHLFRRGLESVRWNLLNCNAQCDPCNGIHETEPLHYEMWFRIHYGNVAYDALKIASQSSHKFTYIELLEIRDELRGELSAKKAA